MAEGREHIVQLNSNELRRLRQWLMQPNGSLVLNYRVSFDAVENGGLLIRTQPYQYPEVPRD